MDIPDGTTPSQDQRNGAPAHHHTRTPPNDIVPPAGPKVTRKVNDPIIQRRRIVAVYFSVISILCVAVAGGVRFLSPIVIAATLFFCLASLGVWVFTRRPRVVDAPPFNDLKRELNQTRRGFERLFTSVPCFICVIDRDHRILEANAMYREEFGATNRSFCYEVCKKRTSKCPNCVVDLTFADGLIHSDEEILVTRDHRRVNAVVHTMPIVDDDGEISAVMEVFTDVTEVKALQRQLALMGRAVAGMAHRIKNILMGLEGGIFVVNTGLETDDRETIAEGWEMVERNVHRVSRIVMDLLYCSKDRTPDFKDGVCPNTILMEVRDLFADRMAEEGITLETELCDPPVYGTFDPGGLHNMLTNLVANAIDACRFDPSDAKEHHTITLRCTTDIKGSMILEVEDDGAGIPDEMNSRVFEDFFSTKGSEGTGIGLLVVQKVAEEHGGDVTFTTEQGKGTTFTVTLPATPSLTPVTHADA